MLRRAEAIVELGYLCCPIPTVALSHMCTCRFEGVVPSAHAEKGREAVQELGQQVGPLVDTYVAALEARKLKDGIRIAMAISSVGEFASCIKRKVEN